MFIFIFHFFQSFGSLEVAGGDSFFNNSQSFPRKTCSPDLKQLRCFGMKSQFWISFRGCWACHTLVGETMPGLEVNQVCHGWFSRWSRRSLVFFFEAADNFPTCSRWFSHSQIPDRWKRKLKSRVLSFIKQALVEKTKIWNQNDSPLFLLLKFPYISLVSFCWSNPSQWWGMCFPTFLSTRLAEGSIEALKAVRPEQILPS